MVTRRFVGALLVAIGIVSLAWGGVFWTDRDTVIDAGPFEVATEEREGVAVPRALGAVSLVGGILLCAWPLRRRV